jgi:hypothetical protein
MKDLLQRTKTFLADFQDVQTTPVWMAISNLSVYLRERYALYRANLFGKEWILALESADWNAGTPGEYRQQVRILGDLTKTPVILVLATAVSTLRNRLVRFNVPFIVPGTQVFLPMSFINLTERHSLATVTPGKKLTPTAQVLILYQILRGELHALSSKDVAARLGYSGMMITKARAELEAKGICKAERAGKETRMFFDGDARAVWAKALPFLESPVAKRCWAQWDKPVTPAKMAGMTALSQRTLISDDNVPTFALKPRHFKEMLELGMIHGWPDENGAHACVECWKYDPGLLSDGPLVDPLSLYLSLRHDPDERVQGELESMMRAFVWR